MDQDQDQQNIDPDLDPKPFDTLIVFLKEFFWKANFEKSQQMITKVWKNYPACKELIYWDQIWFSCIIFPQVEGNAEMILKFYFSKTQGLTEPNNSKCLIWNLKSGVLDSLNPITVSPRYEILSPELYRVINLLSPGTNKKFKCPIGKLKRQVHVHVGKWNTGEFENWVQNQRVNDMGGSRRGTGGLNPLQRSEVQTTKGTDDVRNRWREDQTTRSTQQKSYCRDKC